MARRPMLELKRHCWNISLVQCDRWVHSVALLVPRHIPLPEMRLGQIGCGMQNPRFKVLSCRQGSAKSMPSTSLQDWKAATAPLLPQKRRWYDAGGFPYRSASTKQPRYASGCLYPSRWLPWQRRYAQQVYLKLMIIRVDLQFYLLYRRLSQYKRKLSGINTVQTIIVQAIFHINIICIFHLQDMFIQFHTSNDLILKQTQSNRFNSYLIT
ncbi:Hypothetical_protein [Hexamita inflata]|uniref:Hypothetical_protein n=1 Tax=Hexamita inflata TaxID=28002 RepID=A0AA86P9T3_9EUKA|nr:Hypothetical protein HINF_LOCUS22362 [Hexamita inflata]